MKTGTFVELRLGGVRVGMPLHAVERVLRAAAVTPVPNAPACLHGMLDLHGEPTPVYDTRRLLGLESREIGPDDRFVLARGARGRAAFVADSVTTVSHAHPKACASFAAASAGVRGVSTDEAGMLFVHDLERFLFLERAIPVVADDR